MDIQLIEKAAANMARVIERQTELEQQVTATAANLQAAEQKLARMENGGFVGSLVHESFGASVRKMIEQGEAPDFERFAAGNSPRFAMKLATSIKAALVHEGSGSSSESGTMPSRAESGSLVGPVIRPLSLLEVLQSRPVNSDAVEYVRLGVSGDAQEQEYEADVKAEVVFAGEPARAEIATIAAIAHASRQVLSDVPGLQMLISGTMTGKVASRLEHQILNGPGGAGRIHGILALAAVHTPVSLTPAERIGEAVAGLAADGYRPSVIVLHPSDWFKLVSERGGDDHYILSLPTTPLRPALWGCNVVTTPSIPQGRALVMDPTFTHILDREKTQVGMSESHADNFVRNLVSIRCELRAGLEFGDIDSAWQFDLEDASSS